MIYWNTTIPDFNHQKFFNYLSGEKINIKPYDEDVNRYRFVTHIHIR